MKTPMKSFLRLAVVTLMFGMTTQAFADDVPATKDVVIGVNDVYIPGGFDSQADAYVVVNGIFSNGCYRWKAAEVKNVDTFNHEVRSIASVSQGMCIMVLMPFTKEVRLGRLATGTHTLKFMSGDGTYLQKTLTIE